MTIEAVPGLDATRTFATVTFEEVSAVRVDGDVERALLELEGLVSIFVAAEQVGGLRSSLRMTVDYAKIRYSFGLPIGAYQGVKHKLADMYTDWALADAAVRAAAEAWDDRRADRSQLAVAARVTASPVYVKGARNAMLLHGGIGFTWEHDAHLFYKNAISDNVLFGGPEYQRRRLAELLG
jgi:alkylation response protein AidB-like acyl-CoA dehydrogenase